MPPKADASAATGNITDAEITYLCHIMAQADEFKVDHAKLAPFLGIKDGKNVPRKINGIVNKVGFEYKNGKIVPKDEDQSVPATPKAIATDPVTNDAAAPDNVPQTPVPKKKGKAPTTPKTPASKKRKVKATQQDDDDDDDDADIKTENVNGGAQVKAEQENGDDE